MTDAELTAYIRSLVNEETAKFWTSTDITAYKKVAYITVQSEFHSYLLEKDKTFEAFAMTNAQSTYNPPGNYHKIIRIEETDYGQNLEYISDDDYWKYSDYQPGKPIAWIWDGGKIRLIPTPNTTSSTYLRIWYTKKKDSLADFEECLHPLIAIEAVIASKVKDENVTIDLMELKRRYNLIAYIDLSFPQMGKPPIMSDASVEDREI